MRYQIFLLLRWVGRLAYRACSWLSNKVYKVPATKRIVNKGDYDPVEKKLGAVLGAQELLADSYDPKRQFRWILTIDGVPAFVVNSTRRPCLAKNGNKQLWATFFDPVVPSTTSVLWKWWQLKDKRNARLVVLDPVGIVVEEWNYTGLTPAYIDFGELDYSRSEPVKIDLCADYENVELVDEQERVGSRRE